MKTLRRAAQAMAALTILLGVGGCESEAPDVINVDSGFASVAGAIHIALVPPRLSLKGADETEFGSKWTLWTELNARIKAEAPASWVGVHETNAAMDSANISFECRDSKIERDKPALLDKACVTKIGAAAKVPYLAFCSISYNKREERAGETLHDVTIAFAVVSVQDGKTVLQSAGDALISGGAASSRGALDAVYQALDKALRVFPGFQRAS